MLIRNLKKMAYAQIAALILATSAAPFANADIVTTQQLLETEEFQLKTSSKEQLQDTLSSALTEQAVIEKLTAMGVDIEDAKARIAHLTPAEAQQLSAKIDEMPAGGDVVLLLVIIILVLLLT